MQQLWRRWVLVLATLLAPVALIVAFTIVAEWAARLVVSSAGRSAIYALVLVLGAAVTLALLRFLASRSRSPMPVWGGAGAAFLGVGLGVSAVGLCAASHYLVYVPAFAPRIGSVLQPAALVASLGPALLEEAGFRAGIVHALGVRWGPVVGLLGGSVPFGLLHLAGVAVGRVPSAAHVVGVSAGGWLLSLVYLRWGLLAAAALHWAWNSLASNWARATQLKSLDTFEGLWTTVAGLVVLSVALHVQQSSSRRRASADLSSTGTAR